MKISVLSLFRDSESYIQECLSRLDKLEKATDAEFSYYFYENDSVDNTRKILSEWVESRGYLFHQDIGTPKFGSVTNSDRFVLMAYYRNILLKNCGELDSDYTLILDSDVIFEKDLINQYLEFIEDGVLLTPNNVQNINCAMCCTKPSYYDSLALQDLEGNQGMTWSCNPFYNKRDRDLWNRDLAVKVSRAFGGAALIKTEVLNKVSWNLINPTIPECEHWGFCDRVRQYGDILVIPTIHARVEISPSVLNSIHPNQYFNVASYQKKVLRDYFNSEL